MDGRRRKTVHAARRPEERPKDASHSSAFTVCTSAMLTLPSFAGPTSARSVTRTVRMRFSVGTGAHEALRGGVQVRRAGGASDGGDIGRGERVAHGRPEERVAVMEEEPDMSQASVLGIGGVPHELGDPPPATPTRDPPRATAAAPPRASAPLTSGRHGRARRRLRSPSGLPPPPPIPDLVSPSRHASCEYSLAIKCPRKP